MISLSGLRGHGKTTVANMLIEYGWEPMALAGTLKDACAAIFGWPRYLLEGESAESRIWRSQVDEFWTKKLGREITPVKMLQEFGTEIMRHNLDPKIWLFSLERGLHNRSVVTDARFHNELDFMGNLGATRVFIHRPDGPPAESHASEQEQLTYTKYNYQIINDGWESLRRQVAQLHSYIEGWENGSN